MDKLVNLNHMMNDDLFCYVQHGFVPRRSCTTQLLVTLERWTELLDDGDPVDVIYLGFRNAFDTITHRRLINKLEVNGKLSTWTGILSGIPQGRVLGSILFVLFINDLPDDITCTAKIFADDTKLFQGISSHEDCLQLQGDLNWLVD